MQGVHVTQVHDVLEAGQCLACLSTQHGGSSSECGFMPCGSLLSPPKPPEQVTGKRLSE